MNENMSIENKIELPKLEDYPDNPPTYDRSLKLLTNSKQLIICHSGFKFDSYFGWCANHCSYCYSRGYNQRFKKWNIDNLHVADLDRISKIFELAHSKKTRYTIIEKCIKHRYPIRLGASYDCFQDIEKKYKITYDFIDKIMNKYDYPYVACTKNKLVASNEYLKLYEGRNNVAFQFTLSTLNEDYLSKIELGASSVKERLDSIELLSSKGYHVGCRISPHIPEYMDDLELLVQKLHDVGCKHIISELLRISPILNKVMIKECNFDVIKLYKSKGVKLNSDYYRYPLLEKIKYQKELKKLCDNYGMTFATCGDEDPSFHTVKNCCGFDCLENFAGAPFATYDTAFNLCKERGKLTFDELIADNWCPNISKLKKQWESGYYENVLMNFEYNPEDCSYIYTDCNKKLKRINNL